MSKARLRLRPGVVAALVLLVLTWGAAKLSDPLRELRRQGQELAALRAQRDVLAAEKARLEARKRELASPAGQERAARRLGYLRPGERRLVFVPDEAAPEAGEETAEPDEQADPAQSR